MLSRPVRRVGLELLDRIFGELERLRIELADEHFAEVRVPDHAVLIDQDVVRLDGCAAHVVLGHDGAGVAAGRARQGLELILPVVDRAQIDGGEILGHLAVLLGRARARLVQHGLRLDRLAHRAVAHHAGDHLRPLVGVVGRAHDALERVAARAVEQHRLLVFGARDAHHPFGVGELAGEVLGLVELDVGGGRLLGDDVGGGRRADVVADGADGEIVLARLEAVLREGVAALARRWSR